MADRGPLTWAPIQLSTQRVVFDTSCMESVSETHGGYVCTAKDSVIRVESDGHLRALVNQGRFRLLAAECVSRNIELEFLCEGLPAWISHVEKHESSRVSIAPVRPRPAGGAGPGRYHRVLPPGGSVVVPLLVVGRGVG